MAKSYSHLSRAKYSQIDNMYKEHGLKSKRNQFMPRKSHNLKHGIQKAFEKSNFMNQKNPTSALIYKKTKKWVEGISKHQKLEISWGIMDINSRIQKQLKEESSIVTKEV